MDFISTALPPTYTFVVLAAGVVAGLGAGFAALGHLTWDNRLLVSGAIAAVVGIIGVGTGVYLSVSQLANGQLAVIAAVEDRYGLTLEISDLAELNYPESEPKSGTTATYGTANVDIDGVSTPVTLAWSKDGMLLLDMTAATAGTELPRR